MYSRTLHASPRNREQPYRATADVETSPATQSVLELDPVYEGEYCMPGEINIDNEASKTSTKLTVEVKDYPGLLRVLAWVIKGVDLTVENAKLSTDDEGMAVNTLWVTDCRGRKLSNQQAELLAERVGDFVVYCTPDSKTLSAKRFESGRIVVDNEAEPDLTVVTINERKESSAALLDVASAMTGIGVLIHEAIIQGEKDNSRSDLEAANVSARDLDGPKFKFWVSDRHKQKLDYARATALLFTLNLVFGTEGETLLRTPVVQHSV
ncbi:g11954 [Coccomyxa viridis]|uniref:G11954 protein n=1 Tax=Coccomyxa viridis TaxID=1274662 RepID=A0ABP1GBV4_9CHLO